LFFDGASSDDVFRGGLGRDEVDWFGVSSVVADLNSGQATGFGNDRLVSIEDLFGDEGDDTLIGDGAANLLVGFEGDDHLEGRGGNDRLRGGADTDFLDGGAGTNDRCRGGETVLNCE
jgi:hypothetical protein